MKRQTKTFDCVDMQHEGAERIRKETAGMTREQELEYWRAGTESLLRARSRSELRVRDAANQTP